MSLAIAALAAFVLASIPALLVAVNLVAYRRPARARAQRLAPVSLLIPARNEETNIGACLEAAAASHYPHLEILVMDDHSDDGTAEVVNRLARQEWQ